MEAVLPKGRLQVKEIFSIDSLREKIEENKLKRDEKQLDAMIREQLYKGLGASKASADRVLKSDGDTRGEMLEEGLDLVGNASSLLFGSLIASITAPPIGAAIETALCAYTMAKLLKLAKQQKEDTSLKTEQEIIEFVDKFKRLDAEMKAIRPELLEIYRSQGKAAFSQQLEGKVKTVFDKIGIEYKGDEKQTNNDKKSARSKSEEQMSVTENTSDHEQLKKLEELQNAENQRVIE